VHVAHRAAVGGATLGWAALLGTAAIHTHNLCFQTYLVCGGCVCCCGHAPSDSGIIRTDPDLELVADCTVRTAHTVLVISFWVGVVNVVGMSVWAWMGGVGGGASWLHPASAGTSHSGRAVFAMCECACAAGSVPWLTDLCIRAYCTGVYMCAWVGAGEGLLQLCIHPVPGLQHCDVESAGGSVTHRTKLCWVGLAGWLEACGLSADLS
jgi:hypothetical protein